MSHKIIYPGLARGSILSISNNAITIKNRETNNTITISGNDGVFDNFHVDDEVYYSFAISKEAYGHR